MINKARVDNRIESRTGVTDSTTIEVSKVSIAVVGVLGVAVGIWSLACLVGGLTASGGVMGLVMNWVKAVSGA